MHKLDPKAAHIRIQFYIFDFRFLLFLWESDAGRQEKNKMWKGRYGAVISTHSHIRHRTKEATRRRRKGERLEFKPHSFPFSFSEDTAFLSFTCCKEKEEERRHPCMLHHLQTRRVFDPFLWWTNDNHLSVAFKER